jgi:hypothetical protein
MRIFTENQSRNAKIRYNRAIQTTTLPQKRYLRVIWYQDVKTVEGVQTLRERATMLQYTYFADLVFSPYIRIYR